MSRNDWSRVVERVDALAERRGPEAVEICLGRLWHAANVDAEKDAVAAAVEAGWPVALAQRVRGVLQHARETPRAALPDASPQARWEAMEFRHSDLDLLEEATEGRTFILAWKLLARGHAPLEAALPVAQWWTDQRRGQPMAVEEIAVSDLRAHADAHPGATYLVRYRGSVWTSTLPAGRPLLMPREERWIEADALDQAWWVRSQASR